MGRGSRRYNERGELRKAKPGEGNHEQLWQHHCGYGFLPFVPGDQFPDRDKHVYRGNSRELFADH